MRINEVSELCNITKRAIKYYEEKHLLDVKKRSKRLSLLYNG